MTCSSNSLPGTQKEDGEKDWSYLNLIGSSPAQTTTVQPSLHHDATTPSYVLHSESSNPAVASPHLANDRRLFCGAPSTLRDDSKARLLQRASTEAKNAAASSRKIIWIPHGITCITICKELTFPDGRHYSLKTNLVKDPEYVLKDSYETQTCSFSSSKASVSTSDKSTHVLVIQFFTMGD